MELTSDPVDLENPGFSSLLGALKAVHEGQLGPEALSLYHRALTEQLQLSRTQLQAMDLSDAPAEVRGQAEDRVRMSLAVLDVAQGAMDAIQDYVREPSDDAMGRCVACWVASLQVMEQLQHELG